MPDCPTCGKTFAHKPRYKKTTFCCRACANFRLRSNHTNQNAHTWFWSKTEETASGCINWVGAVKTDNGYGVVHGAFGISKASYAHRVAFQLANGRVADGVVRHKCDNRRCVNHEHLEEGSILDNVRDAIERKRFVRGAKHARAKFTEAQVKEIRKSRETHKDIAIRFGVSDSTICRMRNRKTWADLL